MVKFSATVGQNMRFVTQIVSFRCDEMTRFTWTILDLGFDKSFPVSFNVRWVWVNTYRYIFSGMNIHLPAILGFTRYQGFDP